MKTYLYSFLLLGGILAQACSRDNPTPTPTPVTPQAGVTYALDTRKMSGTGKVSLTAANPTNPTQDVLTVHTSAKAPSGASEYIHLTFSKAAGKPDTEYKLIATYVDVANSASYYYNTPGAATVAKTSTGNWSGTFSGTHTSSSAPASNITDGVFTELTQ